MSANEDHPKRRKPAVATTRGKEVTKGLAELAAGIDGFCARMNTGLCAVALVLGFAVLVTLSVRMAGMDAYSPDLQAAADLAAAN